MVVASNRLPVRLHFENEALRAQPAAGGLAAALSGLQGGGGIVWVGWPGTVVPPGRQNQVRSLLDRDRLVPVFLEAAEEEHYYQGLSNGALWPLLHSFPSKVVFTPEDWRHYVAVNERFAEAILAVLRPDDRVWVHDFHLMLVPALLRRARPELEIGFFLHVPFPSSELYRLLPVREEILRGLLGADLIGFHTHDYVRHFRSCCLRVLGLDGDLEGIHFEGRRVALGCHPIGIDVERYAALARSPEVERRLQELTQAHAGRRVLLGVERLDYSKGIPLKLSAFERFLERDRGRAERFTLLQVTVPSRLEVPEYASLKREIEEMVGRLNGRFGRPGVTPVQYLHRDLAPEEVVALYRLAEVAMVTPVRDGMNLVAQEYALCQEQGRGVLLLSEFAGAAHCLPGALLTNPWDVDRTADQIEVALAMPEAERTARLQTMVERVRSMECHRWGARFAEHLTRAAAAGRAATTRRSLEGDDLDRLLGAFCKARRRLVLLDYDGTLRELTLLPAEAVPPPPLLQLLRDLASLPDTEVHLVSGRRTANMDAWFGALPLHLSSEHGFAARPPGGAWESVAPPDLRWMERVIRVLAEVSADVPGTFVESKTAALAWHYRMADPDYGVWRARELVNYLKHELANDPVEVIHGHRIVEVRAQGISKGSYAQRVAGAAGPDTFVLCIGDDRTDQDMYAVLPPHAVTVHVGARVEGAAYTLPTPARARALLRELIERARRTAP